MDGVVFTPVNVLFKLNFSPASLFYILIFFINLGCLIYILRQKIRPFILNILAFYILALIYWAITGALSGYWLILSSLSLGILPAIILFFTFIYVKKINVVKNALVQILFIFPSIIFLQLTLSTDFLTLPIFTNIYLLWLGIVLGISLWELVKFYRSSLDKDLSKQTLYLILTFSIFGALTLMAGVVQSLGQIINFSGFLALFYTFLGVSITYKLTQNMKYTVEPDFIVSQIIDTLSEAVIVINVTSQKIEYVNKTLLNLLKYRQSDLLGADASIILQKEAPRVINYFSSVEISGSRPEPLETALFASNGAEILFTMLATPFTSDDESAKSMVVVATDTTELKELLNISLEQQKLEAIIESISDGVIVLNTVGEIVMINSSAQTILNVVTPEIKEKKLNNLATFIHRGSILNIGEYLKQKNLIKPVIFKEAQAIINNINIPVNITFAKLVLNQIVDLGLIITIHDLRKEKELALKKLDFVTITAHELRTPLTALKDFAYVWLKDHQAANETNRLMEQIKNSADKLISLVENLLKITKIE